MEQRVSALSAAARVIIVLVAVASGALAFSDATTAHDFGPRTGYRVVAAVDWNNDKHGDLICTSARDARVLEVRVHVGGRFHQVTNLTLDSRVVYAASADFNRDGRMDVMVALESNRIGLILQSVPGSMLAVQYLDGGVAYMPGSVNLWNFDAPCTVPQVYAVRTAGGSDLITIDGIVDGDCNPSRNPFKLSVRKVSTTPLGFSAAPDLNGDCQSDPVVQVPSTTDASMSDLFMLQRPASMTSSIERVHVVSFPTGPFGTPTFADWSGRGTVDIVLPACLDSGGYPVDCPAAGFNAIVMLGNRVSGACPGKDCCGGHGWGFDSIAKTESIFGKMRLTNLSSCAGAKSGQTVFMPPQASVVRPGDYNDDARLDGVVSTREGPLLLTGTGDGQLACGLLSNFVGGSAAKAGLTNSTADPFFFDLEDDGRLDFVTTNTNLQDAEELDGAIYAFNGNGAADGNYYLTAVTINGGSPAGFGWGAAIVGATHRFQYTDINQNVKTATATQYTTSAGASMQPIRAHFGLAITFSYVMNYATGYAGGGRSRLSHSWPVYLMPNSQMVVIASPTTSPSDWILKMFLFGQRFMRLVLIAWLASLGVLGIPLAVLKFREIQADRRELHKHE